MISVSALVATDRPARYIKQLVSHMGHRLPAEISPNGTGVITFPDTGRVTMTPTPGGLMLRIEATDTAAIAGIEPRFTAHLLRFATHETLSVTWSDPTTQILCQQEAL